jgi:hypothetical protein
VSARAGAMERLRFDAPRAFAYNVAQSSGRCCVRELVLLCTHLHSWPRMAGRPSLPPRTHNQTSPCARCGWRVKASGVESCCE